MPDKRPRAFISYSHLDRTYGVQTKDVLSSLNIDSFLAHEDLHVSDEWRTRILEELASCRLFIPLLSTNFVASNWAPQEVGFIISRPEVIIAPLSIDGTMPFGFVSHLQSRRIGLDGVTRELLVEPLGRKFPRSIIPALINIAENARDFRSAESRMRPLVPFFPLFAPWEAQAFANAAVGNSQIWGAALCATDFLPQFIRVLGKFVDQVTLRALSYQIENRRWFRESE